MTTATAAVLPVMVSGTSTITAGITAWLTGTTLHMYKFTTGAGTVTIKADVASSYGSMIRANADLLLTVYNPNGGVMTTINPAGITAPVGLGVGPTNVVLASAGT
jgi:hypothetical protein